MNTIIVHGPNENDQPGCVGRLACEILQKLSDVVYSFGAEL